MDWYYVDKARDAMKWQVQFEDQSERQLYEEREAAIIAAGNAARSRYATQGKASGVRIRYADGWRDDEVFAEGRGRRRG